ncbi:hypothetical protein ACFUPX_03275, partial [Streptomyces sp. NPDC057302]
RGCPPGRRSIGSSEQMVKMIGFGLAIAVFFDAFIVRMALVPAVLALPNVDVEGEGLRDAGEAGAQGASDEGREFARV